MIRFKQYYTLSEAVGDRIAVQHLYSLHEPEKYSMNVETFRILVDDLVAQGKIVRPTNSTVSEKVDGMALKVGVDAQGFYIQSSYSGRVYSSADFKDKIKREDVRNAFQENFEVFKNTFYGIIHDSKDTVLQFEWLYKPLATVSPRGVTFVAVTYDNNKLGTPTTLVLISVQTDLDQSTVEKRVLDASSPDLTILRPNVELFEPIDLSSETDKALDAFTKLEPVFGELEMSELKRTRKSELKKIVQQELLPIQKAMYKKVVDNLAKTQSLLGGIEGYVIKTKNVLFKVNAPSFMASKFGVKHN